MPPQLQALRTCHGLADARDLFVQLVLDLSHADSRTIIRLIMQARSAARIAPR
jgi:hypothetical protein